MPGKRGIPVRLKKRLNNNAVIATDDQNQEYVVFGNGIAFSIKKDDLIPEDKIERVFFQKEKTLFQQLIEEIPQKYFDLSCDIIEYMEERRMGLFSKLMKKEEKKEERTISIREEAGCVYSPVNGRAAALESLDDGMFSEKILGDGVAVTPSDGEFVSPVTGTVETAFPTGHAYGIRTDSGLEILIHIGIDTVALNGKGFQARVQQGQKVKAGDPIASVDLDTVRNAGYPVETMVIVTSGNGILERISPAAQVSAGDKLFKVK